MHADNQTIMPDSIEMTNEYISTFHEAMIQGKEHDPKTTISTHFLSEMGVTARVIWASQGLNIIVRAPNHAILETFWSWYRNGSVEHILHSLLWRRYIGHRIGITDMTITAKVESNQYYQYSSIYLESQGNLNMEIEYTSIMQYTLKENIKHKIKPWTIGSITVANGRNKMKQTSKSGYH